MLCLLKYPDSILYRLHFKFIEITRRLYIITTRYYVIGYIHAHLIFFTNNKDEKSWIADVCLFDILRKLE